MGWVRAVDVDVAFAVSFAVDCAWLWASGQLAGARPRAGRVAAAAAAGALADLWSLFPSGWPLRTWPGRLLAGLVAVTLAYGGLVRPRALWRLLGFAYAAGMLMAGAGLLLAPAGGTALVPGAGGTWHAVARPAAVSWPAALGAALALAGGRLLLEAALAWRRLRHGTREVEVVVGGTRLSLTALVDTGCRVQEPLSRRPVLVAEAAALAPLLPPALAEAARAPGDGERLAALPPEWAQRVRLVPYQAVGTPAGLLLAFQPEALRVAGRPPRGATAYVALSPVPLDPSGTFRALLPAALCGEEPGAARSHGPPDGAGRIRVEDGPDASGRDGA